MNTPVRDFFINDANSEWSSFYESKALNTSTPYHKIKVQCRTFQSVLSEFGVPYYLKIDIEGNDDLCLTGLDKMNLPEYISLEASSIAQLEQLKNLGYNAFKIVNQSNHCPIEMPEIYYEERNIPASNLIRLLLNKVINRITSGVQESRTAKSPHASSGTFGDLLPGRWYSYEDAVFLYLFTLKAYYQDIYSKTYGSWNDFHAKK